MKTPAATRLGVLLLCAVLPLTLGDVNREKAGSCPAVDRAACKDVPPAPAECQRDSQCPGSKRCCCHNCTKACTETVTVHRGSCPKSPDRLSINCTKETIECTDDSNCTASEKCCHVPQCTTKCVKAVEENTGYCPIDPGLESQCGPLAPPRCSSDAECAANEKCCLFGCGMQCVKALPGHLGHCPLYSTGLGEGAVDCRHNSNCSPDEKCCSDMYMNRKCLKSLPAHDGFCPPSAPETCSQTSINGCNYESTCKADEKCCFAECRKKCVKSVKGKPGSCRSTLGNVTAGDKCNKCNEDIDCPDGEKCCSGDQGRECQKPHLNIIVRPGKCPIPYEDCSYPPPHHHECNHDGECPRGRKCCIGLCTRTCQHAEPVTGKPGTCPAIYAKCLEWTDICTDDSDCPGSKKCCYSYCEKTCVEPETAHIGVCPTNLSHPPKYFDYCQDDIDCYEYHRCCTLPQGRMCVLPVPVKCMEYL